MLFKHQHTLFSLSYLDRIFKLSPFKSLNGVLLKHQHSMYQIWRFGHEFRSIFFRSKAQIKCYNNRKIIVQGQFKIRSKVYIDIWLIARIEMKKKKKLLEILVLYISLDGYIEIFMTSVWLKEKGPRSKSFRSIAIKSFELCRIKC